MLTQRWAKSSLSFSNGNCVEARWRKSSHSESGNCAEARTAGGRVQVRDSKDPGPVLSFTPAAWQSFLNQVKV